MSSGFFALETATPCARADTRAALKARRVVTKAKRCGMEMIISAGMTGSQNSTGLTARANEEARGLPFQRAPRYAGSRQRAASDGLLLSNSRSKPAAVL